MAGKSKKQKTTSSNTASTKRTLSQSTSLSTASPILKSAFSPSWSKLSLFSSVLRGLDAQRLRCHDTTSGRLQCEYIFDKTVEVNSLTWGSLAETDKDRKKKKRKRASDADAAVDENDDEQKQHDGAEVVIAATSSTGKIFLYSPVQAELVKTLEGGHAGPVTDFQFVESSKSVRAWSCGGNKLVEWDVKKGASIRNIAFGESINFFRNLPSPDSIICASYATYVVDPTSPPTELASTFSSHTSQIHTLRRTAKQHKFLSAADGDRFIYVSDIKKEKSLGSLVAKGDVTKVDTTSQDSALVAVTADGIVEVFTQPWSFQSAAETEEEASVKRKKALTKTSEARVKIVRPDNTIVKVIDACFHGDSVLVAWVENATSVLFEKVKCLSAEGGLTISGDVVITKTKTVGIGGNAGGRSDANDIKDVSNVNLKQSHTVVVEGADMQDIGMVDAPEKSDGEEEGAAAADSDDEHEDNADDPEEQTFEDRIKALNLSAGGSADSTEKSARSDLSPMTNITVPSVEGAAIIANKTVKFPNATSLTTVLTQALKTDDRALLETCLQVTKVDMIESTIQRLDSLLAADLVTKLAEIIARKPGRAGSLMVWIQKTLVNHGGHLLTLPDLVRTLASLQRVLGKRAEALPKMLALRGRLSMLVAQMKLRSMARDRLGASGDAAVVYVEGVNKDDESSSDEEEDEVLGDVEESEDEDEDSDEGMNGVLDSASEGEEDEESEDDEDGPGVYLDREAEETDDDSTGEDSDLDGFVVDDDEVDYESQDDGILDDESEEETPKVVKKGKSSRR
ncbi:Small subunit (SSU) processome component [Orbilia ellipsospora]|uniref:Small subunit (SSU) processome component n=1 Tax=Orbilia ellipsospora TaxID=2528407 RepID=A0AAV9X4S9_9PEZI